MACVMGVARAGAPAFGQAQPADNLQPGVNTSAMPPQPANSPATAPARTPPAHTPAAAAPAAVAGTAKSAAGKPAAAAAAGKSARPGKAVDRIELDTTQSTGNTELPKVMYVVTWRHADLDDLTGKPANSLVDEVLQPVDRDVFNREERYYHTVAPQKSPPVRQTGAAGEH